MKNITEEKTTDFGQGFIYCLINFAKHFDKVFATLESYGKSGLDKEQAYSIWINGASDHLYDLELPKNLPIPIKKMVKELKDIALDYGHGSKMMIGMSEKTYKCLRGMLDNIALAIDKWLEVKTSKARWD